VPLSKRCSKRSRKQDSEFFKNDTWQVCYFNTGWAREGWDIRVKLIKDMCEKYELKFNEFESHSYMQLEILRQIRAFRQEK
jgi:hypothetical protein